MEKIKKIIKNIEENNIVYEKDLLSIEEAISTSMVSRTREAKLSAAIAAVSVAMAKKNNDPLYHKLIKHRKAWKTAKDQIVQKYNSMARQKVISNQS